MKNIFKTVKGKILMLSVIFLIISFLAGCAHNKQLAPPSNTPPLATGPTSTTTASDGVPASWVMYENKELGFRFWYPREWGEVLTNTKKGEFGGEYRRWSFSGDKQLYFETTSIDFSRAEIGMLGAVPKRFIKDLDNKYHYKGYEVIPMKVLVSDKGVEVLLLNSDSFVELRDAEGLDAVDSPPKNYFFSIVNLEHASFQVLVFVGVGDDISSEFEPWLQTVEIFRPIEKIIAGDKVNLKAYSVVNYPFVESTAYRQLNQDCLEWLKDITDLSTLKDFRIERRSETGGADSIVESVRQLIHNVEKGSRQGENIYNDCYGFDVGEFSMPVSGNHIYFKTYQRNPTDAPNSGLGGIYRLDLTDLLIKRLAVSDFIADYDLYRGFASDSYKILADRERLIKWNMDGVYLVNLKKDSKVQLYTVPKNQWLISRIGFGMGQFANYDLKINENKIVVGLYDRIKDADSRIIIVDKYGNVSVEAGDWGWGDDIRMKLINKITITIPN